MRKFNRFILLMLGLLVLYSCGQQKETKTIEEVQFVDPYIGAGGHGHVFVGANVPFGAIQLGPSNIVKGWDWCSGYHYSDSLLVGFSHTHLSGTGIGDMGDLLIMPVTNAYNPNEATDKPYNWETLYSHEKEFASAGYYSVYIDEYQVDVELTASERVAFHKYKFDGEGDSKLIIDLNYGIGWDKLLNGEIKQIDKKTINGHRFSAGWSKDHRMYYHTIFSKEIKKMEVLNSSDEKGTATVLLEFEGNGELLVKTAISPVNEAGAKMNLSELTHWDFKQAKGDAEQKWNKQLAKIQVETKDESKKIVFYTSLYHSMFAPSLFNDVNGDYRGTDKKIRPNPGHDTYTTFSLWDTYRAAHPLFTIVQPERVNDIVNSLLAIYQQQGKLPVWHLMGSETNTMVGYHAVPVIADAYLKGFRGFDAELAFEAMKSFALSDERGLDKIKEMGYIPAESEIESVAKGLEYAIDDRCIAAMAKAMGKMEDYELFLKRSKYYEQYFDSDRQFMRGKLADGSWNIPFNPIASSHRDDDYCEGNAWQYTWLVPQDVEGLIQQFGGDEQFITKLDSLFSIESIKVEGASADISGLIGQYAHGNEPSHHVTYMYAFAGQQWKTAEKVRFIMDEFYTDEVDGIIGNEDCGQMSAWYIYSSMGFYPVNPANGIYVFGSPLFDKVNINLAENKNFVIEAVNNSNENIYIQSVELNGKKYDKSFIRHEDVVKGGTLKFYMGAKPNYEFGASESSRPKSEL